MPKGGGMFSPAGRQQSFALSPAATSSSPRTAKPQQPRRRSPSSRGSSGGRSSAAAAGGAPQGLLVVGAHAENRLHAEREARRQIALDHTQQLRAQIQHREKLARAEQQRSHAAERAAIPSAGRLGSRFEPKQAEPVPWAQDTDPGPRRHSGASGDLKRVLAGEGELVDGGDAVWDTAQGIWRKGGSPRGRGAGGGGGLDAIVEPPEGWTAADQKRLAEERAARAAQMEAKWDDGMSNISDALSELLDSLTVDSFERMPSPPPRPQTPPAAAMPMVFISREGQHSKGRKKNTAARGTTTGLLYHRDAQCPVPAPVEKNIAIYAKLIKSGGAQNAFFEPFSTKNDHFTKTGSGQT